MYLDFLINQNNILEALYINYSTKSKMVKTEKYIY